MSSSRENTDVSASTEDRLNAMRGYKATLHNPNTSKEAKQHAQDVLDNEIHGNEPQEDLYDVRDRNKDPNRVAGGLKAAQTNPRVTDRGRENVGNKLDQMGQQPEE